MAEWNIVRTQPAGRHRGRAIPIFINNWQFHLTTLDVYDDGVASCWEMLDLPLLDAKLTTSWIATEVPAGATISVHNLGAARVAEGQWTATRDGLRRRAHEIVSELNPRREGLVDLNGEASEQRGKGRYAKLTLADDRPVRDEGGVEIAGSELPVFVVGGAGPEPRLQLARWFVFADGQSRFDVDGPLLSFAAACEEVAGGRVATAVADGSWVEIGGLGRFLVDQGHWGVAPAERIREAADELAQLRGEPGAVQRCVAAHRAYEQAPSQPLRDELRRAYEAVPKHRRLYCGDMDSKDWPIRRILEIADDE